jgi:sugar phosphate isomerase/epimerase
MSGSSLTRRRFLASSLSLTAAPFLAARTARATGVQLYTVRNTLMKDSDHVLRTIADIGYKEIEGGRADLIGLVPKINDLGMKTVSCHVETPLITGDWDQYKGMKPAPLEEAIESVRKAGIAYFSMAYIQPQARGNLDFYRKTADQMNHAGELCHKAGLQFAYHNHAFEFGGKEGERPIDIFHERLDRKLVALEMDVFWVSVAGQDPIEALSHLKGRVPLMHLKDKAQGTEKRYNESVPKTAFKEVGHGTLDWPKVLRAADAAGVEHYFVEQDQTPWDPVESLRQSYQFLSKLEY